MLIIKVTLNKEQSHDSGMCYIAFNVIKLTVATSGLEIILTLKVALFAYLFIESSGYDGNLELCAILSKHIELVNEFES